MQLYLKSSSSTVTTTSRVWIDGREESSEVFGLFLLPGGRPRPLFTSWTGMAAGAGQTLDSQLWIAHSVWVHPYFPLHVTSQADPGLMYDTKLVLSRV